MFLGLGICRFAAVSSALLRDPFPRRLSRQQADERIQGRRGEGVICTGISRIAFHFRPRMLDWAELAAWPNRCKSGSGLAGKERPDAAAQSVRAKFNPEWRAGGHQEPDQGPVRDSLIRLSWTTDRRGGA